MPLDYSDPVSLKFITERNNQDNVKNVHWFLKHRDEIVQRSQYTENHKHYTGEQIDKKQIECGISALSKHHEASQRHRRKHVLNDATALSDFFIKTEQPIMKPVEPNESNILYKEIMAGGGRVAYLNTRKRKLPEQKYSSCETSNVYGWELGESYVINSGPKHARYAAFLHDLTRISGVHQDPPHYKPPIEAIYKKCIGHE